MRGIIRVVPTGARVGEWWGSRLSRSPPSTLFRGMSTVGGGQGLHFPPTAVRQVQWSSSLPGLDLAMRVAFPSHEFPATGLAGKQLDVDDPRIYWREYFSLEKRMPYYHHLPSDLVVWSIPDGFVTRFPKYYLSRSNEFEVNQANGEVRRVGSSDRSTCRQAGSSSAQGSERSAGEGEGEGAAGGNGAEGDRGKGSMSSLSAKQKLAAYGSAGLLLYLIVHNIVLLTIFSLLYFFDVDLVAIARSYGFNVRRHNGREELQENARVENLENSLSSGHSAGDERTKSKTHTFFATLGLAIVLTKMIVPLQLAVTLVLAPSVAPRLQPMIAKWGPQIKSYVSSKPSP